MLSLFLDAASPRVIETSKLASCAVKTICSTINDIPEHNEAGESN